MNKQSPGIGWCSWTWNPVTGCRNACPYCYARAMAERFRRSFEPQFHPDKLDEPRRVRKPARVFVGSTTDFGSDGVQAEWLRRVVAATRRANHHRYLALTKRPDNIPDALYRVADWWFGVTVTRMADLWRVQALLKRCSPGRAFVSFEPILEDFEAAADLSDEHRGLFEGIDWAIIGALTHGGRTVSAKAGGTAWAWVSRLRCVLDRVAVPVYAKSNLEPLGIMGPRDFPDGLKLEGEA